LSSTTKVIGRVNSEIDVKEGIGLQTIVTVRVDPAFIATFLQRRMLHVQFGIQSFLFLDLGVQETEFLPNRSSPYKVLNEQSLLGETNGSTRDVHRDRTGFGAKNFYVFHNSIQSGVTVDNSGLI
jgi:hypothetical protein